MSALATCVGQLNSPSRQVSTIIMYINYCGSNLRKQSEIFFWGGGQIYTTKGSGGAVACCRVSVNLYHILGVRCICQCLLTLEY